MQVKQSEIDKFLAKFKLECDRSKVGLEIVSSHRFGSHYFMGKITLDRSQIQAYADSSNVDPLETWRIVSYHELGHHLGHISEESCWDWLEQQSNLDQPSVRVLRSQAVWGRAASVKGRDWECVKKCLNSQPIQEFIRLNQLSTVAREAAEIQTPGLCWHFVKKKYQETFNLEQIIKPLIPNSSHHLTELCYVQKYDCLESELTGLRLWREIQAIL